MISEIIKNFIVFEGIDGTGTTTQLKRLETRCKTEHIPVWFTCEPTGSEIGKLIRAVLKGALPYHAETLAYLFAADRAEHLYGNNGIISTCYSNTPVVSDRYFFSSLAYQGLTCSDELAERLNGYFPLPELLFYFSLEPETALERIAQRETKEIFENLSFQGKVKQKFDVILARYTNSGMQIHIIDAKKAPHEIEEEIWTACSGILQQ